MFYVGRKGTALPSGRASRNTSRRETVKYSHQPQWRSEDM